ncbi:unknown [Choristoneura occidentalis granulovirus]|uniref:Uncharacterized protein n=1 Tax=Choristoneura occidentalis granulovirus TaxID=364745 RepID=Q1A4J5_9BBAC|nr:unknown [Choristoneura fumiferana granulovirus]ABC61235.1 unknown [Choristoneura fumiferana granulovirus]
MGLCCNSCLDKININDVEDGNWEDDDDNNKKRCCFCCTCCRCTICLLVISFIICIVILFPSIFLAIKTKLAF